MHSSSMSRAIREHLDRDIPKETVSLSSSNLDVIAQYIGLLALVDDCLSIYDETTYQRATKLRPGTQGQAFLYTPEEKSDVPPSKKYVVKLLLYEESISKYEAEARIKREAAVWNRVYPDNMAYTCFDQGGRPALVMPYLGTTNIGFIGNKSSTIKLRVLLHFFEGLNELHKKDVAHGDIGENNVQLDEKTYRVFFIDFGRSMSQPFDQNLKRDYLEANIIAKSYVSNQHLLLFKQLNKLHCDSPIEHNISMAAMKFHLAQETDNPDESLVLIKEVLETKDLQENAEELYQASKQFHDELVVHQNGGNRVAR
jgi:serine/threonine protein kinase